MDWSKCEREFIRAVEVDQEKIASIVDIALKRKKFLDIGVNKDNVSFVVEGYYEIIKEFLVAFLLKNGLKSKNHQCLITYFYKQYPEHEYEANLISQMSYLRNRLNYYGEAIDMSFYEKNKDEIDKLIMFLAEIVS